jgi:hypothetical protein
MTEPRYTNTGGGPYLARANVTHNGNRSRYGAVTNPERDITTASLYVFASARQQIDTLGGYTDRLHDSVTSIEAEVARGEAADGVVIAHALRTIAGLVPELAAALAAGLLDPSAGVAVAVQSATRWALREAHRS